MRAHVCANVSGCSSAASVGVRLRGDAAMLRRLAVSELCLLSGTRLLPVGGNCTPLSIISACTSLRVSALLGRPICTLSCATGGADMPLRRGDSISGDMLPCCVAGRRVGDGVNGVTPPATRIRRKEGVSARLAFVCTSAVSLSPSASAWPRPLSPSTRVLRADLSARCRDMPLSRGSPETMGAPCVTSDVVAEATSDSGNAAGGAAASVERRSPTRLPPAENMCRKASGALRTESR